MTAISLEQIPDNLREYNVAHTFDRDFCNSLNRLHRKYGDEVFEVLGIANRNLDIALFSEDFFSKSVSNVADVSVDDNANVSEKNISHYESESTKALQKLNSAATMYTWVKKCFSKKDADTALEKVLNGEVFCNDFSNWNKPYSYYQETPILIRVNGGVPKLLSMRKLFAHYQEFVVVSSDREEINLSDIWKDVDEFIFFAYKAPFDNSPERFVPYGGEIRSNPLCNPVKKKMLFEIWDGDRGWVILQKILRHKRHCRMVAYQTGSGNFSMVTEDHPIVLEDMSTKLARDLVEGDAIREEGFPKIPVKDQEVIDVPEDLAYLIGFLLGDGNISRSHFYYSGNDLDEDSIVIKMDKLRNIFYIYQKDIEDHKIYSVIKNTFKDIAINLIKPSDKVYKSFTPTNKISNKSHRLCFSSRELMGLFLKYFDLGFDENSWLKSAPSNILSWKKNSLESFVAGIIDSEGTVAKTKSCNIRCASFNLISTLSEILNILEIPHRKRLAMGTGDKKLESIGFPFMFGTQFMPTEGIFEKSEKYFKKFNSYEEMIEGYQPQMRAKDCGNKVSKVLISTENPSIVTVTKEDLLEWVYDITTESSTFYSNGMIQHNCFAFDLRNLIFEGMSFYKGNMVIKAPKRSSSFIALMIQTVAYISNQIMGAFSAPDFFCCLNYFYEKEFGKEYLDNLRSNPIAQDEIKNQFQNFIYSMNFPFRGAGQSAFTNFSVLDKGFMKAFFTKQGLSGQDYIYPDNTTVNVENTIKLSQLFFEYYSEINSKEGIFTFPVMTLAISKDSEGNFIDKDFVEWVAKANSEKCLGNIYIGQPDSFSSCCRMRSDLTKNSSLGYQNSFGVASLGIGSHRCVGLNLPRLALLEKENPNAFEENIDTVYKILHSHRKLIESNIQSGTLPLYTTGWISLKRQYSTIGFVGMYEYIKNKGITPVSSEGQLEGVKILKKMESKIIEWQEKDGNIFNIEQIPGESMCPRLVKLDNLLGFNPNKYELYSNQYLPLWEEVSIYDRFKLQGKYDSLTSGGAILHINVQDSKPLSPTQFKALLEQARISGTTYFAINLAFSECEQKHYSVGKQNECSVCKSKIVNEYTRVVGYLSKVSAWNKVRRNKDYPNRHFYKNEKLLENNICS